MAAGTLRKTVIAAVAILALTAAASRFSGSAVELRGGQVVGYSQVSREWLFADYPAEPLRRDGPYVLYEDGVPFTLSIEPGADGRLTAKRSRTGAFVDVVADPADPRTSSAVLPRGAGKGTDLLGFRVPLRPRHPRAAVRWPMPDKLLIVSDLEGEFAAAVRLLQVQGVIGDRLEWTYGDGHLVLVGDMVDRGPNVVPLLWLIYKLEAEAKAAGGRVHYLLGNHERYVLQGRPKSAHPKHLATARATGLSYGELWSQRSELGRWLRSKPVMIRIGDSVFVHGSVSPAVLRLAPDLDQLDALAARHIGASKKASDPLAATALQSAKGVLADRTLATRSPADAAIEDHLQQVLNHFHARRIVVGHTRVEHVGYTHGGRVLRTDVAHARQVNEAILWSEGQWWRVDAGGVREPLPAEAPVRAYDSRLSYLSRT